MGKHGSDNLRIESCREWYTNYIKRGKRPGVYSAQLFFAPNKYSQRIWKHVSRLLSQMQDLIKSFHCHVIGLLKHEELQAETSEVNHGKYGPNIYRRKCSSFDSLGKMRCTPMEDYDHHQASAILFRIEGRIERDMIGHTF